MKKFFSLVLALVMALSLTTVAWGAGTFTGATIEMSADTEVTLADATAFGAGKAAAIMGDGGTFNGNDKTLTFNATGDNDVGIVMQGEGTIQNVTVTGPTYGIDGTAIATSDDITISNVTILNTDRALHFQTSNATDLNVSNSVFQGKISYVLNGGTATFTNCTFKAGGGYEDVIEPWSKTVFVNCVFEEGFKLSFEDIAASTNPDTSSTKSIALTDCTYAGVPVTAANMSAFYVNYDATTHSALQTSAFTAVAYNVYDANGNLVVANTTYTLDDGAPYDRDTGMGEVEHYTIDGMVGTFVEVSKADKADADYYVTLVGQSGARMYLKEVAEVVYEIGYDFTNVGTACGQLNVPAKYDYYYTKNADGTQDFWKGEKDTAGSYALMVGGELVQVSPVGDTSDLIPHDWAILTINEKHEVTSIECEDCGVVAKVYDSKLAAPKGAWKDDTYGWIALVAPTASTTPSTDKVTSADTFDAGIAMYVGMSVMAAAGGAVVIGKKKD